MKLTTAILALTFSAVAAFNPSSSISSAVRAKAPFAPTKQAMVQPINLDGRVNNNDKFVSHFVMHRLLNFVLGLSYHLLIMNAWRRRDLLTTMVANTSARIFDLTNMIGSEGSFRRFPPHKTITYL